MSFQISPCPLTPPDSFGILKRGLPQVYSGLRKTLRERAPVMEAAIGSSDFGPAGPRSPTALELLKAFGRRWYAFSFSNQDDHMEASPVAYNAKELEQLAFGVWLVEDIYDWLVELVLIRER